MPKLKELSNEKINEYLKAYKSKFKKEPTNQDLNFKIKAMEKALQDRSLLGLDVTPKEPSKVLLKIKNILNKNKD